MATEQSYGTGRRKTATARVFLRPGKGDITVNKKSLDDYFGRPTSRMIVRQALEVTDSTERFDIYVTVEGSHTYMGDLTIQLESPTGEIFDLFLNELGNNDLNGTWVFGVSGALGVSSVGDWTIHITDNANFDEGSLTGVELEFRGADATTDTVHHITGDFTDYLAQEAGRGTIEDSDGGTDWLNMAALTDAIAVTLATRRSAFFSSGTRILTSQTACSRLSRLKIAHLLGLKSALVNVDEREKRRFEGSCGAGTASRSRSKTHL